MIQQGIELPSDLRPLSRTANLLRLDQTLELPLLDDYQRVVLNVARRTP